MVSRARPVDRPTPAAPAGPFRAVGTIALLALLATGCGRACKRDHPHVPYTVGDAPSGSSGADGGEPPPGIDSAASRPAGEAAVVAPAGAKTWNVEGLELVAPAGSELLLAIVRDFDGDGKKDALAIVRPPAPSGKPQGEGGPAQIIHYAGASSPPLATVVASAPPPRTEGACAPIARLERVGPRSALAEVGASCTTGASSRALFVVRLAREPGVAFDLAILDPPGAPKLTVDVDGADRDRDGVDDVTLHLTIEGGGPPFEPGPRLTANVAFFDRSAGPSRDPDEPDASLRTIAAQATARAGKAKDAPSVPVLVQQMRMLFRAMCAEGGAPRLVKLRNGSATGAVSCGSSKPLEDAGVAEVRSFATQGDALRAVAAADVAQLAPATRTAARSTELTTLLAQVAPLVQARGARTLSVVVSAGRSPHPEWGPLAFEPSGKLLVRTATGVTRVDLDSGESADADLPAWPTQVLSPDGKSRWLEAYHACEGVALRATFAPTGADGDMRDVLLPVAPPLGSRCAGGRGEAAATTPIAWGPRGLEVLVAGQPLLVRPESSFAVVMAAPLGEMPPFGSPRSAGGRALAVATSQGVLVKTTKAARYRASELEPYSEVRQCTTTDDASRIACVKRGRVVIGTFDPL